jgi:hypothetical protein
LFARVLRTGQTSVAISSLAVKGTVAVHNLASLNQRGRHMRATIEVERQKIQNETLKIEIDAMFRLAEARWRSFDTRRSYEWKVNFSIWAATAALTGFLLKGGPQPIWIVGWAVSSSVIIFLVYWIFWSTPLWRRNQHDFDQANRDWMRVQELLKQPTTSLAVELMPHTSWIDIFRIWKDWSRFSQLTVTTMLLLGLALAAWASRQDSAPIVCL